MPAGEFGLTITDSPGLYESPTKAETVHESSPPAEALPPLSSPVHTLVAKGNEGGGGGGTPPITAPGPWVVTVVDWQVVLQILAAWNTRVCSGVEGDTKKSCRPI